MPLPPLERESEDLFFSAFTSETEDREDHSFSGVFFSIGCDSLLPVSRVEVTSLSVRGPVGRVRVYVKTPVKRRSDADATREPNVTEEYGRYARGDPLVEGLFDETAWGEPTHDETHESSLGVMVELKLNAQIVLERGEMVEVYVHSDVSGDGIGALAEGRISWAANFSYCLLQIYPAIRAFESQTVREDGVLYTERELGDDCWDEIDDSSERCRGARGGCCGKPELGPARVRSRPATTPSADHFEFETAASARTRCTSGRVDVHFQ